MATDQWKLTTDRLIRKGYFPLELPPPFNTSALADSLGYLPDLKTLSPKSSKSIFFSIPKSWPARRVLSVPNPLHQTMLCQTLSDHWPSLKKIFEESAVSLSTPTIFEDGIRAVSRRADFDVWSVERFRRSSPSDSFFVQISRGFITPSIRIAYLGQSMVRILPNKTIHPIFSET